jgi:hypothetical protein
MKKYCYIVLFCLLVLMRSASAATLADHGKSTFSIVVAQDAVPAAQAAAADLQKYFQMSTGATLPLVHEPPAQGGAIYVGAMAARMAGVTIPANFDSDQYLLQAHGNSVILAGNDPPGDPFDLHWNRIIPTPTFSATSAFLEKYLGARWFWPGDAGTVIPHRDRVDIPDFESVEKPDFIERRITFDYATPGNPLWARHNRLGYSLHLQMWHNWYHLLPENKYLKDHPEYFALVNGKRGVGDGATGAVYGHQLCVGNIAMRTVFTQNVLKEFQDNPTWRCVSISANDGGKQCQDKLCRALDVEKNPDGTPVLTDRMFNFFNDIATRVDKAMPGKILGVYAYDDYAKFSPRVHVAPNLYVGDVYNSIGNRWWSDANRNTDLINIDGWRHSCKQMVMISYYYQNSLVMMGLPQASPSLLAATTSRLKTDAGKGWDINLQNNCLQDKYLISQLLWKGDADVDALRDDYYDSLFGTQAGALVRQADDLMIAQEKAVAQQAARDPQMSLIENSGWHLATMIFDPIRERTTELLDKANQQNTTPEQKARLAVVDNIWRYTTLTLDALHAVDSVAQEALQHPTAPDAKVLLGARAAIENRRQFIEDTLKTDPDHLIVAKNQLELDQQYTDYIPFEPALARIKVLLSGHKSVAFIPAFQGEIPQAADWNTAVTLTPFLENKLGQAPQATTQVKMLYNRKAMFLHVVCAEPGGTAALHDGITQRDGEEWSENDLELFIDPDNARKKYFQLVTNSIGGMFDALKENGKTDVSWNGDWSVHTSHQANGWTADFTIPFASLGMTAPTPGDIWGFNICRVRPGANEYSAWSPTFGLFDNPQQFGQIVFR